MKRGTELFKYSLLPGILLFLFMPVLQNLFHYKWIKPLKGAYYEVSDPEFSKNGWVSGEYQEKKETFLDQNFGLRNYFVRLNNQLDFILFNKANVNKVVIGKGGFLYESNYIEAYYGTDFTGKEKLEERYKKLKIVQDFLRERGIFLEVIFAPSKASFYPEFIPDDWVSEKKLTNMDYVRELCKKHSIRHIDFGKWFLMQKGFSPYDLYPRTGIHWSNYGALIAFDSIIKHTEYYTKLNLKTFTISSVAFSDSLRDPDNDIGDAMNLLWKIQPFPMPYADYKWVETEYVQPKALFIGDSYFWNIFYEGLTNNVFEDCKFWYYNETVYPEPETEPQRKVKNLNLPEEIKKQKLIYLLATECNVQDLGWGFIEKTYEAHEKELRSVFRKNIYVQNIKEEINNTPVWLSDVKKKAEQNKVSVEKQIELDALFMYETDYGRQEVIELTEETKKRIMNTPEWVRQIKEKAKEKNVSFEEMLELDAKFIYVTEQRPDMK